MPLYYTEWNLPAESVNRFPAEQVAAWIGASLNEMQKNGRIDGAAFFRIEHYRDPYSSLFDQNGTPRTAFRVLHFFDTMPERALTIRTDELPGVTVTAAGSPEEVALLIARYDATRGATSLNTDMVIRHLAPNRTYQLEISRENADNAAKTGEIPPQKSTVSSSASGTIQLPLELAPFDTVMIRIQSEDGNGGDTAATRN